MPQTDKLADVSAWLDTSFKQIERPRTTDRIVNVQLNQETHKEEIDDAEEVQRLHYAHN